MTLSLACDRRPAWWARSKSSRGRRDRCGAMPGPSRAHVVVDCAAYFELMHEAMLNARQRIFLIGWDFDSRIRLLRRRGAGGTCRAGIACRRGWARMFVWLAKRTPALQIRLLKWNFGALQVCAARLDDRRSRPLVHAARNRLQVRFRASDGLQPPSEDRRDRRLLCGLRRHRHDLRTLGHVRAPARGQSAPPTERHALRAVA